MLLQQQCQVCSAVRFRDLVKTESFTTDAYDKRTHTFEMASSCAKNRTEPDHKSRLKMDITKQKKRGLKPPGAEL